VDRLSDEVHPTERKAQVTHAAGDQRPRTPGLDPRNGLDERQPIVVVLLHSGTDSEDVGVEDDVLSPEAERAGQHVVGAPTNRHPTLHVRGLPLFVEGHHDHRSAVLAGSVGVLQEGLLAFFQRERVDDRLALQTLQARFDHL